MDCESSSINIEEGVCRGCVDTSILFYSYGPFCGSEKKKKGGGGAGRSCENSSNNRWAKIMFAQAHSLLYQLVCPFVGLLFRAMVGTQPDIVQICLWQNFTKSL